VVSFSRKIRGPALKIATTAFGTKPLCGGRFRVCGVGSSGVRDKVGS